MYADPDKWSDASISVLVCDDGAIGRRLLTVALEQDPHIEVVAEADGGETALAEAVESTPDVVWMGLGLPGLAGVGLIASIGELVPSARCVVMYGPEDGEARARALRIGAQAAVRRDDAPQVAVEVTRQVAWGHPWLEARDLATLRDAHAALARQAGSVQSGLVPPRLDAEAMAVLDELARERSEADVAQGRGWPPERVQATVANALALLQRHARTEAMAYSVHHPEPD
jgi:DNA-binding NarL/FixJ family response regulator